MNNNTNKCKIENKNSNSNKEILFTSNPKNISFLTNIVTNCYYNYFDNTFCIFNSINNRNKKSPFRTNNKFTSLFR